MPSAQVAIPAISNAARPPNFAPSQQMLPTVLRIPAGETRPVNLQGQWFYIKELYDLVTNTTADDLQISTDLGGEMPYNVGTGARFPGEAQFRHLIVRNSGANSVYVEIIGGYGDYIDNRLNIVRERPGQVQAVQDQPTEATGWVGTSLAATTGQTFDGTPPAGYTQRKAIIITNRDATTAELQIRETATGNVIGIIFASTAQVYFVSGSVEVFNPNGAPISCHVGEIWYVQTPP